jgi:hypothetical protein
MRLCAVLVLILSGAFGAQAQSESPDFLISSGVTLDYATGQPSANVSIAPKIATLAGKPTYSYSTFESSNLKFLQTGLTSAQVSIRTGFLQVVHQRKHWGVFVLTDGGVLKFDAATLSNFTGGVGLYFDLIGYVTKDKHHGWVSPIVREVAIAGMQVKPVYGVQVSTVFNRK